MKSNFALPEGIDPTYFYTFLTQDFQYNLSDKLCTNLANILAIDYSTRLAETTALADHAKNCQQRLKSFLGRRVITDESFSSSMHLFTVAISPEVKGEADAFSISEEKSQDAIVEMIITTHFANLSGGEKAQVKLILKDLLKTKSASELLNFINADPKAFQSLVINSLQTKKQKDELLEFTKQQILRAVEVSQNKEQQAGLFSGIFGKVALTAGALLAVTIGTLSGGLAMPIILVPAAIAALRYGPELGDKAGSTLANRLNDGGLANVTSTKESSLGLKEQQVSIHKEQSISQEIEPELGRLSASNTINLKEKEQQKGRGI